MNSNTTNSINIQNIPVKKVHVGDIDIATANWWLVKKGIKQGM
jgi:hypothetical protein